MPFIGWKHSEESKKKMSLAHKGKYSPGTGFLPGHSAWNKGKNIQTNSGKTHFKKGFTPWNKGEKVQSNTGRTHFKKGQMSGENSPTWKGGKPNCPYCNKKLSTRQSKTCRYCWIKVGKPTSIEKIVYNELKKKGIIFEKQKVIGNKFTVDVYIPSINLVIECDGDYWHSMPINARRDASKDAYLSKCGFDILRLLGSEIEDGRYKKKLEEKVIC